MLVRFRYHNHKLHSNKEHCEHKTLSWRKKWFLWCSWKIRRLFHYLLLVVSVSGNFLIRSDKCVANFPYYVFLMWAPEAKSSSIGGALKQDPLRNYSATNCWQFYLKCKCALTTFPSTTMYDEIFRMMMLKHDLVSVVLMVFYKAHLPPTLVPPTASGRPVCFFTWADRRDICGKRIKLLIKLAFCKKLNREYQALRPMVGRHSRPLSRNMFQICKNIDWPRLLKLWTWVKPWMRQEYIFGAKTAKISF